MLDYKYKNSEYYNWMTAVTEYVEQAFKASVELTTEESGFIYELKEKRVQIQGVYPPRDKLYVLLHEVGHLSRLMENPEDNTFFMNRSGDNNTKERVMTLMEEVLAWHKAEEIADRLEIPIEKRAWQRLVNKTVQKYVGWACNKEI